MLKIGQQLATTDGTLIGNGIIVNLINTQDSIVYTVQTDFGNLLDFDEYEIASIFKLTTLDGCTGQENVERWMKDRRQLIDKNGWK